MLWSIIRKEFKMILSDKGHLVFLFVLPIIFISVMNLALSEMYSEGVSDVKIPILNLDKGEQSETVIKAIEDLEGFTIEEKIDEELINKEKIDELIKENKREAALIFPENFSEKIENNEIAEIEFVVDPATSDQVLIPIEASVKSAVLGTIGKAKLEKNIEESLKEIPPQFSQIIDSETIKKQIEEGFEKEVVSFTEIYPKGIELAKKPSANEQHIPGYTIMFVFFIMTAIVESLIDEKVLGTFRRIIAAPISKTKIIIGKFFPYYIINILQIAVMFLAGIIFFRMEIGNSFLGLLLVTITLPLVSTMMGMFISTISKTKNQGTSIAVIATLIMATFGGLFVPLFVLPDIMQLIAKYTPMGAALMGYQDIIVRNLGISAVMDNILILLIYAFSFFGLAIWKFKFED